MNSYISYYNFEVMLEKKNATLPPEGFVTQEKLTFSLAEFFVLLLVTFVVFMALIFCATIMTKMQEDRNLNDAPFPFIMLQTPSQENSNINSEIVGDEQSSAATTPQEKDEEKGL